VRWAISRGEKPLTGGDIVKKMTSVGMTRDELLMLVYTIRVRGKEFKTR
jgi:hypothetical protein